MNERIPGKPVHLRPIPNHVLLKALMGETPYARHFMHREPTGHHQVRTLIRLADKPLFGRSFDTFRHSLGTFQEIPGV